MTEDLTAEDRGWLDSICDESTIKLLRLYDAALARTEVWQERAETGCVLIGELGQEKLDAEAALAEATALLERTVPYCIVELQDAIRAFLSRTPAPAAPVTHLPCSLCDEPLDSEHPKGPCVPCHELPESTAPAAESEPELSPEQMLRASLRARIAELEAINRNLREHHQDRVAELERELAAAREAGRAQGRDDVGKYSRAIGEIEGLLGITTAVPLSQTVAAVRALRAAIDAAVVELGQLTGDLARVAALSLLRAAQKAAT